MLGDNELISRDPEILSGTPVFMGTRVPIQNLHDYLGGGHTLDEFLDDFPSVSRDQALGVLELLELGYTEKMGPMLRREVEQQLLADLRNYGVDNDNLQFDWSDTCPEGHVTDALDGTLENWSGVAVRDANGTIVADGWLDFIHGGGTNPLFVFWEYLTIYEDNKEQRVKNSPGIPQHVWDQLPVSSKELCTKAREYDAAWCNDPLVTKWQRER